MLRREQGSGGSYFTDMPYFRAIERTPQGLPILARTWRVGSPSLYLYWLMSFSSQGTSPKSQRSRYSSRTWRASCSWHPRGLSVACVVVEETETCTRPRKLALPEWTSRVTLPGLAPLAGLTRHRHFVSPSIARYYPTGRGLYSEARAGFEPAAHPAGGLPLAWRFPHAAALTSSVSPWITYSIAPIV